MENEILINLKIMHSEISMDLRNESIEVIFKF